MYSGLCCFAAVGSGLCGDLSSFPAYVTQEAVGLGDGFFFLAAGCYLGFIKTVFLFSASLLLCFPVSSFLMVHRIWKGDKAADRGKERLPFLPFVLLAAVFLLFW